MLLSPSPLRPLAAGECADTYFECKDNCLIEFGGSVRVEMKKRYEKCMKKCSKEAKICADRTLELQATEPYPVGRDTAPATGEASMQAKKNDSKLQTKDDEPQQSPPKARATKREEKETGLTEPQEPATSNPKKKKKVDDTVELEPIDPPKKISPKKTRKTTCAFTEARAALFIPTWLPRVLLMLTGA